LAIADIARIVLPTALRIVNPLLKSLPLNLMGDVEIDLHNASPLLSKHLFKFPNVTIAASPNVLGNQILDPGDQNILVVASIPDANFTLSRTCQMTSPEVVVLFLHAGGNLEAGYLNPGRI
jgi:hypothetical protein